MMEQVLAAIREEMYSSLRKIFNAWMQEAGVRSIQVDVNYDNNIVYTIYTDRPGLMIGYKGSLIDKYKKALQEQHYRTVEIKFVETRYSFQLKKDLNEDT